MSIDDFLQKLSESENRLLISNARDYTIWHNLKHNKQDLELFLNNNLTELSFRDKSGKNNKIIASSNTQLIKMFSLKKSSNFSKIVKALSRMKSKGIRTKNPNSVMTWDFSRRRYCVVPLDFWFLGNWITISEDNIELLNETLRRQLDRK